MNKFKNNEGWEFERHPEGTNLFSIPVKTILMNEQYWIYLCQIAHSNNTTRLVYFVDVMDRTAWVTMYQCKSELEARKCLDFLMKGKTPNGSQN